MAKKKAPSKPKAKPKAAQKATPKAKPKRALEFVIEPNVGALPVKFGMTAKEVADILGKPESSRPSYTGNIDENRMMSNIRVGYLKDTRRVNEISFCKWSSYAVMFKGIDLFRDETRFQVLLKEDDGPIEMMGFLVFPKLGIGLTGFHSRMAKTITVMATDSFDASRYKPYDAKLLKIKK